MRPWKGAAKRPEDRDIRGVVSRGQMRVWRPSDARETRGINALQVSWRSGEERKPLKTLNTRKTPFQRFSCFAASHAVGSCETMRVNMGYSSPLKARSRTAGRRASSSAAVSAWRRATVATSAWSAFNSVTMRRCSGSGGAGMRVERMWP